MEFDRGITRVTFNKEEKRIMENFVLFAKKFLDEMYESDYEEILTDEGVITTEEFEETIERVKSILESEIEVE